jgi:hypothetical protein
MSAVVGAAATVAACTNGGGEPAPTDPGGPEDPDRGLRAEIGRSETALIDLYAAATGVLSGATREVVAGLGERHPAYRQAIDPDGLATQSPTASPTGSASPSPPASPSPAPTVTSATAVAVLLEAESRAAKQRAAQCVRATDPELARVIALAGAGCAAAAEVLRGAG